MARGLTSPTMRSSSLPSGVAEAARLAPLLGRVLLSMIFLMSGAMKLMDWEHTAGYMASKGLAPVPFFLVAAALVELAGGLCVLFGCWARLGALALVLFLIPTTVIFHNFWVEDGMARMSQMQHFLKNLAIMGGLLMVLGLGPGPFSFDVRAERGDLDPR